MTMAFDYFIHEKVTFIFEQKAILIGELTPDNLDEPGKLRIITEDIFFDFQNAIRESMG
jgi:hypothetical protein